MICNEQFLEDIVEVQFYKKGFCQLAVTPFLPNIYEAEVTLGTPIVDLALTPDNANDDTVYGVLTQSPTLKVTSKRSKDGDIYTHDLTCTVEQSQSEVANAIAKLARFDAYIIYIKADGSMFLTYTLPNATSLTTEDNAGSSRTLSVKGSLKSLSGLITATKAE